MANPFFPVELNDLNPKIGDSWQKQLSTKIEK